MEHLILSVLQNCQEELRMPLRAQLYLPSRLVKDAQAPL